MGNNKKNIKKMKEKKIKSENEILKKKNDGKTRKKWKTYAMKCNVTRDYAFTFGIKNRKKNEK